MTRKKSQQGNSKVLNIPAGQDETPEIIQARTVSNPAVRAAVTVESFSKLFGETDLGVLIGELQKQSKRVHGGDLKRAESMLITQAHTLDAIFNELARRSSLNMGEYINAAERYMRLALKAQSQCRATLETLSTIKNPPVVFAKQANIANGPQQVNNGTPTPTHSGEPRTLASQELDHNSTPAHVRESINHSNELLEHQHGERLDTGTSSAAIGFNKELETLGAIHRAEERGR